MTEPIKPAMTPEQWRMTRLAPPGLIYGFNDQDEGPMDRHRLAAMCLYRQSFGFTREDVKRLRQVAEVCDPELHNLADRIEALLPPEETASPE